MCKHYPGRGLHAAYSLLAQWTPTETCTRRQGWYEPSPGTKLRLGSVDHAHCRNSRVTPKDDIEHQVMQQKPCQPGKAWLYVALTVLASGQHDHSFSGTVTRARA